MLVEGSDEVFDSEPVSMVIESDNLGGDDDGVLLTSGGGGGGGSSSEVPMVIVKPKSAWMLYLMDHRSRVIAEMQAKMYEGEGSSDTTTTTINIVQADIFKVIGESYRNLTAEEKLPYEEKAALDKERYKLEISQNPGTAESSSKNLGKKLKIKEALQGVEIGQGLDQIVFPISRVKKTIKIDPDVRNLKKESLVAIAKATELFVGYMALYSANEAANTGRSSVRPNNIIKAVHSNQLLAFLRPDFPKSSSSSLPSSNAKANLSNPPSRKRPLEGKETTGKSKKKAVPANSKAISSYFTKKNDE
jgi:hypothetical protein